MHANLVNNDLTEEQIAEFKRKLDNLRKLAESLSDSQIETVNKFTKELNELRTKFELKKCINFLEEKTELIAKIKKKLDNNEEIDYKEILNIYEEINEQLANNAVTYGLMTRNERNIADAILCNINEFYDNYNNALNTRQEEQVEAGKTFKEQTLHESPEGIEEQPHSNSLASSSSSLENNKEEPLKGPCKNNEEQHEEKPVKGSDTFDSSDPFGDSHINNQDILLAIYTQQQLDEQRKSDASKSDDTSYNTNQADYITLESDYVFVDPLTGVDKIFP